MKMFVVDKQRTVLNGYVKNKTKEIALASILGALNVVGRYMQIPLFLPPLYGLEASIVFWSVGLLVLSYHSIWIFALIAAFTSNDPLGAFVTRIFSFNILYFSYKLFGLKLSKYLSFFASITSGIVWLVLYGLILNTLGSNPIEVYLAPMMIKLTAQGILAIITVPIIIEVLTKFNIIDVGERG